jgi:uncharacterized zinc-type alcohol dehydrogenase-like protein
MGGGGIGLKMSPNTVIGYAAKEKGRALEPIQYKLPPLHDNEVRVSVTHCGLCYSDVHAIDDFYGITTYPFVPGHEIVGHVSELGSAVTGFKIGERVGIGWQGRSCKKCEWCLKGEEHLCVDVADNGSWFPYGGFSTSAKAESRFVYPLPRQMPSEVAAVLLCAGIAVYSPLKTYATKPSQKVGVIGIGGLGHLAIQFAHALRCDVTAISSSPAKEQEARTLGADHFVVATDKERLRKMEYSFDVLLYTTHANIDWTLLSRTVRTNGKFVIVGFPSSLEFDPLELVVHQQSLTGSFLGNPAAMREMLLFAQEKSIVPKIELYPMTQINDAIQRLKENKARYRIVLINDEL